MELEGCYKVIKTEERNEGKVTAKFIYVETTLNKCKVLSVVNLQRVFMIN